MPVVHLGAVTVVGMGYGTGPAVVGGPPQWDDDSDATYAELSTRQTIDVSLADVGQANAILPVPVSTNPDLTSVTARLRTKTLTEGMKVPQVFVYRQLDDRLLLQASDLPMLASMSPEWIELPLTQVGGGLAELLPLIRDASDTVRVEVWAPYRIGPTAFPRCQVYEAHLVVSGPTESVSCRNFPADTPNSVGGGVTQFPPSKAWARSNRFAGGYG